MAKFNISVDNDWIETNEDGSYNLDEELRDSVVNSIATKVQDNLFAQVEKECNNKIEEQYSTIEQKISDKLNSIMEDFFNTPRNLTDKYGDITKKDVTITQILKDACDNFMNQPLDQNGNPIDRSYGVRYNTRTDYIIQKVINEKLKYTVEKITKDITDGLNKKIGEEVKLRMGEKLAGIINLDDIIRGK